MDKDDKHMIKPFLNISLADIYLTDEVQSFSLAYVGYEDVESCLLGFTRLTYIDEVEEVKYISYSADILYFTYWLYCFKSIYNLFTKGKNKDEE